MTDQTTLPQFLQKGIEHFSLALRLLAITLQHRFGYRDAGANGIYIDAERAKCVRQRFGQGDAGDIARRGADRGTGRTSRTAAYVNDASPTSLLHVWRGLARAAIVPRNFSSKSLTICSSVITSMLSGMVPPTRAAQLA